MIDVPPNNIALELGNEKVANKFMLGAYVASKKAVSRDSILKSLRYNRKGKRKPFRSNTSV